MNMIKRIAVNLSINKGLLNCKNAFADRNSLSWIELERRLQNFLWYFTSKMEKVLFLLLLAGLVIAKPADDDGLIENLGKRLFSSFKILLVIFKCI